MPDEMGGAAHAVAVIAAKDGLGARSRSNSSPDQLDWSHDAFLGEPAELDSHP